MSSQTTCVLMPFFSSQWSDPEFISHLSPLLPPFMGLSIAVQRSRIPKTHTDSVVHVAPRALRCLAKTLRILSLKDNNG